MLPAMLLAMLRHRPSTPDETALRLVALSGGVPGARRRRRGERLATSAACSRRARITWRRRARARPRPNQPRTAVVVLGAAARSSRTRSRLTRSSPLRRVQPLHGRGETTPVPLTGGLESCPTSRSTSSTPGSAGRARSSSSCPRCRAGTPSAAPVTLAAPAAAHGSLLLTVCNGAEVLASAGLLDGGARPAHWPPSTTTPRPTRPRRGCGPGSSRTATDRVTTAGILAGIDGTLRVVERMLGAAAAARAAAAIGWSRWTPGPARSPRRPPRSRGRRHAARRGLRLGRADLRGGASPQASASSSCPRCRDVRRPGAGHPDGRAVGRRPAGGVAARAGVVARGAVRRGGRRRPAARPRRRRRGPTAPMRGGWRPSTCTAGPASRSTACSPTARHLDVATARLAAKTMEYPADGWCCRAGVAVGAAAAPGRGALVAAGAAVGVALGRRRVEARV